MRIKFFNLYINPFQASLVGGFSCCFSSKDICRLCHLQHKDLPDIHGIPTSRPWTKADYDLAAEKFLTSDTKTHSDFGLHSSCVFNDLESFHAVGGFPLDPLHDFWEKIGPCDGLSILKILIAKKKFTLLQYNRTLADIRLSWYEIGDRPPQVKPNSDKLPGKALAVALHIRIMPFILWQLLTEEEREEESEPMDLLFLIHQINEFLLGDSFNLADIANLEEMAVEFFAKRKTCCEMFPGCFVDKVPKYHNLEHYPEMLERFGPFTRNG